MQTITLHKLSLSTAYNVRRTNGDKGLEELIASIKAHGLLENLLVVPAANDTFEVIAGGRRLRAIKHLAAQGDLPQDYAVRCELVTADNAEEISLAENMVRTPMHPADQFEAWAKLVNAGMSIGDISARFGVNESLVIQRLKLGRLSPRLMQAYREDTLNLESLMAFTLTDDHNTQEAVFARFQNTWEANNAHAIRSALTDTAIKGSHKLAKCVGQEAYEAAGGTIRRDLFSDSDGVYFDDVTLLENLAAQALEEKAEEIRSKWKWVATCFDFGYEQQGQYHTLHPHWVGEVPDSLIAREEALEIALEALGYGNESEEAETLRQELAAVSEELATHRGFDEDEYALSGCMVYINYRGEIELIEGLVRPEDAKPLNHASEGKKQAEKPRYSKPLTERLQNYRLHAVKMAIANDFDTAFDSALYTMCSHSFGHHRDKWLNVHCLEYHYPVSLRNEDESCMALVEKERKFYAKLPLAWLGIKDTAERFAAFCKLTDKQKQKLFAACVSKSVQPQLSTDKDASITFELVTRRMNVDVADSWCPTEENFLSRISKAEALMIGGEVIGSNWVNTYQKEPKGEIVKALHEVFNKPDAKRFTAEQLAVIGKWLPEGMGCQDQS